MKLKSICDVREEMLSKEFLKSFSKHPLRLQLHCHRVHTHPTVFFFSIGYPVVYLGFDATCYFTNIFKLRVQKSVQSENDFHMHLLQHSLPPGLQLFPKTGTDDTSSSSNSSESVFSNISKN